MNYVDDRLDNFSRIVMKEAAEKRLQVLAQINEEKNKTLEKEELECLEWAYSTIQKQIHKIEKEKSEMISRAMMENKKSLLRKREEIIDETFNNVIEKVRNFMETPEYYEFLLENIRQSCQLAGEGEIVIYINTSDALLLDKIEQELAIQADIQIAQEDIMGGCKIFNKAKGIMIDNSLAAKIDQEKDSFLEVSDLVIP